jgi:hypothetical protein
MEIQVLKDCDVAEISERSRAVIVKMVKGEFGRGVLLHELAERFKCVPARPEPEAPVRPKAAITVPLEP